MSLNRLSCAARADGPPGVILYEGADGGPHAIVLDGVNGADDIERRVAAVGFFDRFVQPFEEISRCHVQHLGKVEQSAGRHPVGADLVLLDLLERQVQLAGDVGLREAPERTGLLEPPSDMRIYGMCHDWIPQVVFSIEYPEKISVQLPNYRPLLFNFSRCGGKKYCADG